MRSNRPRPRLLTALVLAAGAGACGGAEGGGKPASTGGTPAAAVSDLTPFQLEHGIGPVTEVMVLGPVAHDLAERGEEAFITKCSACHKLEERYVGPALGDVTARRSPAFILNMIQNPQEMYTRHPVVKDLLAQYMTQMPNQAVTPDEARAILEYLRSVAPGAPGDD